MASESRIRRIVSVILNGMPGSPQIWRTYSDSPEKTDFQVEQGSGFNALNVYTPEPQRFGGLMAVFHLVQAGVDLSTKVLPYSNYVPNPPSVAPDDNTIQTMMIRSSQSIQLYVRNGTIYICIYIYM